MSSRDALARISAVVDKQAKDEGLWIRSSSIVEAYLQQELRYLHAVIEVETKRTHVTMLERLANE